MTKELSTEFKYDLVDQSTADFLKQKEFNMREIVGKAYTELGRELKEAQEKLAGNNQYNGLFERWCNSIGLKKDLVYRLINRFKLIANCEDQKIIEDLPVSLTYEIAKPSSESTDSKKQAKEAVLNGEVKTLKEYKELEAKLRKAEEDNKNLSYELSQEKKNRTVVEKVIDNTDYKQIDTLKKELEYKNKKYENLSKQKMILEQQLERSDVKVKEYEELTNKLKAVTREQDDLGRQVEATSELSEMVWEIEKVLKGSLAPVKYAKAIRDMSDNQIIMNNLDSVIGHVESWCKEMRKITNKNNIIEVV
ncbi:hypothetical protein [Bacillus subtilis]|uniref:DUF3102 domain-containing protein n=3 Tax=Bacillus subtilis TaxID=1423 RepID=A0A6M3ZHF5_BACSU|nr:hypothetical protein [Bacillus subtilis]APD21214.1 hypothetical protein phi3T_71 [Bacillus phage phi3T]QNN96660.1 hypothetical protein [Bacillus phage phi3Ts]QNN96845.1 hypothetical protein [Bacillus phage Hyb2phi3Ts-SPbeta]QNN97031.1 hypothetical protein [Bacillus phage Hyb3phi3Ts-SPbeta]QNR51564.1 hypothetical protein [Bacillus phage Hyb1phi3Ts-SPbeta]WIT27292.1 hypothetical protein [Bacillus phage SPbetaL3]